MPPDGPTLGTGVGVLLLAIWGSLFACIGRVAMPILSHTFLAIITAGLGYGYAVLGPSSPHVGFAAGPILFAGLLIGPWGAVGYAFVSAAMIVAAAFAVHAGWIGPFPGDMGPSWPALLRQTLVCGILVWVLAYTCRESLAEAAAVAEKLARERDASEQLIEASPAYIVSINPDGTVRTMNAAMRGALGYEKHEVIGLPYGPTFAPNRDLTVLRTRVTTDGFDESEDPVVAKDGRVHIVDWRRRRIQQADGTLYGLGFGVDVTERRQLEREAEEHRRELEVANKHFALANLVSGVAHEINNPNHFIMLNAPILREVWGEVLPILDAHAERHPDFTLTNLAYAEMRDEVSALIDDLLQGSERIRTIVAELRDYAGQIDSEKMVAVDVNAAVRGALTLLSSPLRRATQNLVVKLDDVPPVRGHLRRIEQVAINLLLNACQALDDPDQLISVRTHYEPGPQRVVLTVEDGGCGIPEEDLERITDPFFTTRRLRGGTGLGLAVARRIADQHEAKLEFSSTEGAGTQARLVIPVYGGTSA